MSTGGKSTTAPAFLEKLYDILDDPSLEPYIGWQEGGNSFLIKNVNYVSETVLPKYFKHNNIQSFIRQLNMYSFTKTRHDSNYR
jgi:heat shock transcription factor, other eukaryote